MGGGVGGGVGGTHMQNASHIPEEQSPASLPSHSSPSESCLLLLLLQPARKRACWTLALMAVLASNAIFSSLATASTTSSRKRSLHFHPPPLHFVEDVVVVSLGGTHSYFSSGQSSSPLHIIGTHLSLTHSSAVPQIRGGWPHGLSGRHRPLISSLVPGFDQVVVVLPGVVVDEVYFRINKNRW